MGKKIQEGHHSAITDARTTLALYKIKQQKMAELNVNALILKIERPPKDPFDSRGEYCHCNKPNKNRV